MKKYRCVKLPPDLSDGENSTANLNPLEIGDAVIRWMLERPIGSKVTLEIIELTDEEMDALPSI